MKSFFTQRHNVVLVQQDSQDIDIRFVVFLNLLFSLLLQRTFIDFVLHQGRESLQNFKQLLLLLSQGRVQFLYFVVR